MKLEKAKSIAEVLMWLGLVPQWIQKQLVATTTYRRLAHLFVIALHWSH